MIEAGVMIRVKGKKPDWLDRERGLTYPDYDALVVDVYPEDHIFECMIMKEDGSLWNAYRKNIIRVIT